MPLDQINQKVKRFRREGDRLAVVRQKTLSGIETEGPELICDVAENHGLFRIR